MSRKEWEGKFPNLTTQGLKNLLVYCLMARISSAKAARKAEEATSIFIILVNMSLRFFTLTTSLPV